MEAAQNFEKDPPEGSPGTLGDVLYADKSKTHVSEKDWVGLVGSVAAGNQLALHALYERTHRVVFRLAMRITNNRETAEEATLDVFYGVWRRARHYDAENGTVLGWVMNDARSRAIDRVRFEQRKKRVYAHGSDPLPEIETADSDDILEHKEQSRALRSALMALTHDERLAISASLQRRLARCIAAETGRELVSLSTRQWSEPEWEEVAPGISCKLLATDTERHRVSMLVRLAPGGDYPPHTHAGVEELHLLDGELWIDDRKLYPGDYNRAEPGTGDKRVWSETGCTCVLITSTRDILR